MSRVQETVDKWNQANPVGTDVDVTDDLGQVTGTRTRSEAWVLGGHTAVVQIEGKAGCMALSRVTRREIR